MMRFKIFIFLLSLSITAFKCPKDSERQVNQILHEPFRPQFHFSPETGWMNDPNGMIYHNGVYHLFYQYYPDSTVWGPMHWGHAVSKDLIHWSSLPVALFPDTTGYIFSGSAVLDRWNTSNLGSKENPPLVAIFTHHNAELEKSGSTAFQHQSIAYSLDGGRSFAKYDKNPVISNPGIRDFRDPKVFWYAADSVWVMVLAAYDRAMFFRSPNLIEWEKSGEYGISGDTRLWECPDLFPVTVENTGEKKWILITSIQKKAPNGGTATSYFVGDFNGKTFTPDPDSSQKWLDYGTDNYALVTWSGISDGRILAIGWMSNWQYAQHVPTGRWRSAMTLPRQLNLWKEGNTYILRSLPVKETSNLMMDSIGLQAKTASLSGKSELASGFGLARFDLTFSNATQDSVIFRFSNEKGDFLDIGYDPQSSKYFVDRSHAGISGFSEQFAIKHTAPATKGVRERFLQIYLDNSSVELFADGGRIVMTEIVFPNEPFNRLEWICLDKSATFLKGSYFPLKSVYLNRIE